MSSQGNTNIHSTMVENHRFGIWRLISALVGLIVFQGVLVYMSFLSLFREMKAPSTGCASLGDARDPVSWRAQLRGTLSTIVAWAADTMVYLSGCLAPSSSTVIFDRFRFSYPAPFTQIWVPVSSKIELSCQVASHGTGRMTVILVPGMFNNASMSIIISMASFIHRQWNANVIVVDLRGHGETGKRYPDVPFALTVLEGRDLLEVAKFAKTTLQSESTFLLGVSLGGACVLSAAVEGGECAELITACATVAAPMDLDGLLIKMSQGSLNMWYMFYSWVLICHCKSRKIGWHAQNFSSFAQQIVKPYYAKEFGSILQSADVNDQRISPMHRLESLKVPLLALHSRDDPVIPIQEPERLAAMSQVHGKDGLVRVQMTETGGHAANFVQINTDIYQFFCDAARDAKN